MSFTVNLSGGGLLINRFNSSNMLKSTQEKLQRQQERDNKVAFFEAQKENLKNRKADSLEEISEKLEMFHNYEDEIAAANQEYNNSQMKIAKFNSTIHLYSGILFCTSGV